MRSDEQPAGSSNVPEKPPPPPTAQLLRSVEENNLSGMKRRKLNQCCGRKSWFFPSQPQPDHFKPTLAQSWLEILKERSFARAFGADDSSAPVHRLQPRQQLLPRPPVRKPIANLVDARSGEWIVTRPHSGGAEFPGRWETRPIQPAPYVRPARPPVPRPR